MPARARRACVRTDRLYLARTFRDSTGRPDCLGDSLDWSTPMSRLKIRPVLCLFLGLFQIAAPGSEVEPAIHWTNGWQKAVATAKRLDRPILLYFQSGSCGFCRKLERVTLSEPDVVDQVNRAFVPVKIDGESSAALCDRYHVEGYPALVMISPRGATLEHLEGFISPRDLLHRLEASLLKKR